jgi:bifunctional non-homologous end joining protein LigD
MSKKLTKVEFTNLNKTIFPKHKITKSKIIEYYIKTAPKMLGFLANRPLVLTRFPDGIDKEGFYEKDAPQGTPSWVKTVRIHSETAKRDVNYVLCNDLDTLIWLANLATIEIHMPFSKADSREKPDMVFFDVDPEHFREKGFPRYHSSRSGICVLGNKSVRSQDWSATG